MKVEIYSDVVCPWCYIGARRFARTLASFEHADRVEAAYRPYQLDPDMPAEPIPLTEYLRHRFGGSAQEMMRQVGTAAREEGIEIDWQRALAVNTLTAHRLLRLALYDHGARVQRVLAEKLFEAHFTRGASIADHKLLADLAASAGMDAERAHDFLAAGEGLAEMRAELEQAQRLGIRAVPTFVFEGRHALQGAQRPPVFLQMLKKAVGPAARAQDGGENARANRSDEP